MAHALTTPNVFLPRWKSISTCANKPTCSGASGNNISAHITKIHATELKPETEAAAKSKFDRSSDTFSAKLVDDDSVLRQNFTIRSYELDPNGKASLGSMMKRLQETSIQHCKFIGRYSSGFGSTPGMDKRGLVWVTRNLQMEIDNFPSWDDVIQVDTCTSASVDYGLFRNWVFKDYRTGEILIRANSIYVLMNMKTRRLSKFLPEIYDEIEPLLRAVDPVIDITRTKQQRMDVNTKLQQLDVNTATHVRTSLSPTWTDLDMNQHVSHVKYVDWVFESIPISILKNHEVSSIVLEYRKECRMGDVLQSLSSASTPECHYTDNESIEFGHLLRREDGSVILKGRSKWKPNFDRTYRS